MAPRANERQGDSDRPEKDEAWDEQQRHETPVERLDRNWSDLLQELRVVQTGVQLLTDFFLHSRSRCGLKHWTGSKGMST